MEINLQEGCDGFFVGEGRRTHSEIQQFASTFADTPYPENRSSGGFDLADKRLPIWEPDLVEEAIAVAEARFLEEAEDGERARKRQVQLAREQAYHRLATAIDRPATIRRRPGKGQLSLFPSDPTLLDD